MYKAKRVFAGVVAVIILSSSVSALTFEKLSTKDSEDDPQLKVTLKVREIFPLFNLGWYLIRVDVKNIGNESLHLGTTRPAGGFVVYNESGNVVCRKPEAVIEIISDFFLRPHQRKTLFRGIWTVGGWKGWKETDEEYTIYGVMFSYEYKRIRYPQIESSPIIIYPPAELE